MKTTTTTTTTIYKIILGTTAYYPKNLQKDFGKSRYDEIILGEFDSITEADKTLSWWKEANDYKEPNYDKPKTDGYYYLPYVNKVFIKKEIK